MFARGGRGIINVMWEPVREDKILDMVDNTEWMMDTPVRAFWDKIKVEPQKWQLPLIGDKGGGFWVVAIVGQECVYYNDIEDGFNTSPYQHLGYIQEYRTNQSDLISFMNSYHGSFIAAITTGSG